MANTIFTPELGDKICNDISTSNLGLRAICKNNGVDYSTFKRWVVDNESFRAQYARAKEEQAEMLVEDMLDIADDSSNDTIETEKGPIPNNEWINRSRLRVDTRKWIASKLLPKKYGDKLDVTATVKNIGKDLADETYSG